jgi:hypothetical protein
MNYITKSQLEQYTGLQIDEELDAFLDLITAFAKEYIDDSLSTEGVGKRWFDDADTSSTRYFNGNGMARMYIDDLRSVTSLVASITVGSGITLVQNTDYFLYPLNAVADGKPFEYIELINPAFNLPANSRMSVFGAGSPYTFYEGQRNIAITGKWGYNAINSNLPPLVKMATLKICAAVIKENIGDNDLKELTSESLGEYSASYAKIAEIADRLGVSNILAPLKRARIVTSGGNRLIS